MLGRDLAPSIEVGWTGRTVVSPTITAAEAAQRAATLRRRLLIWDNVPVADGPMRPMLHLGPYVGRDRDLGAHVSGLLLNPMAQARASGVALRTAADYMRDPQRYDPEASWRAALAELGAGAPEAFAVFAAAHRFSPLLPDDRDPELESAVAALRARAARSATDTAPALAALRQLLDAARRRRRDAARRPRPTATWPQRDRALAGVAPRRERAHGRGARPARGAVRRQPRRCSRCSPSSASRAC